MFTRFFNRTTSPKNEALIRHERFFLLGKTVDQCLLRMNFDKDETSWSRGDFWDALRDLAFEIKAELPGWATPHALTITPTDSADYTSVEGMVEVAKAIEIRGRSFIVRIFY